MSQPLSLSNRTGAPYDWETSVRALGQKLATTELLPPDRLRAYRAPLAARLLAHAQQHAPFYRDRIAFDVTSPGAIDRFWPEIPVLRRAEAGEEFTITVAGRPVAQLGPARRRLWVSGPDLA